MFHFKSNIQVASRVQLKPNSITLAGSKLVRSLSATSFEPALNLSATSFEPASVIEFGLY